MTNYRGDVVRILDANGATVATYDYDPWGNQLSTEPTDSRIKGQPIRYAGYVYDNETKLYYLQARYYDPQTVRFISRDPDPGDEDDPITMNGYTYADSNPVMNRDPEGHWAWAVVNAGFAVYDGYKAYKAGKNKKQIAWAVASSFVGLGHVKKANKILGITKKAKSSQVGSYTIFYRSGKTYSGKGPKSRSRESARKHAKRKNDVVRRIHWTPAKSDRDAFIQEHYRIERYGGAKSPRNYNIRHSPGRKYIGGK